jgi:hypothetical protein
LISSQQRKRNVIVLSADHCGYCAINPAIFSDRLCGVAHVCQIYPNASYLLSKSVGKYLSVFDYGIRIYRPTLDFETDDPLRHTLYTKRSLDRMDLAEVQRSILLDAFSTSVSGALKYNSIPTFAQIRAANATAALGQMQARTGSQQIETLRAQLTAANAASAAAQANAETSLDMAIQEEEKRRQAEDERNQERARAMALAARVRLLEAGVPVDDAPALRPTEYDQVAAWVENQFAGRMKLLPRALRGLKEVSFGDVGLVCESLELLAREYVDGRRGNGEAWTRFNERIAQLGIVYSKSISDARAGEQGDEYFVRYRGRRCFLEWHLEKGTARSGASMRIYFFWDEEEEEVIIGSLPDHLDTRVT